MLEFHLLPDGPGTMCRGGDRDEDPKGLVVAPCQSVASQLEPGFMYIYVNYV